MLRPHLEKNESLFGIGLSDLLTVDGARLRPEQAYRKVLPMQASVLAEELADEDE